MDQAGSLAELAAVTRALNELEATAFSLDYGVDMRQLADAAIKELEEQYPDYQIATHLKRFLRLRVTKNSFISFYLVSCRIRWQRLSKWQV